MSAAAKVNLAISLALGAFVALITYLLGSSVWWLFGLAMAAMAFVGIAAAQMAPISESTTDSQY